MEATGDRATAWVRSVLSVAAVAIPLGYVPALRSPFVEPKLALLVMTGACGLLGWAAGTRPPRFNRGIARAAGAFGLVLLISALPAFGRGAAPYAADELVRLAALGGVAAGAAAVVSGDPRNARRLFEAVHVAAGLVALLGLCQHLRLLPLPIPSISVPGSTFGNRNVAAEAVAMALPFGLRLIRFDQPAAASSAAYRRLVILFVLLEIGYLAAARARGAWLGGALGLTVFFALRKPPLSRPAVAAALAMAAVTLLAVAIPGRWTPHDARDAKRFEPALHVVREAVDPASPVARTRLALWRRTLALTRLHPLLGVGLGNFAVLFPLYAEPGATEDGVLSPTAVPRRAHNDLLERWAESGPLGLAALLALYAALGVTAIRRARQARRAGRPDGAAEPAACAGGLAAFVACGLTGFPFAMPATVFLCGVALGILAVDEAPPPAAAVSPPARRAKLVVAAGFAVLAAVWSFHRLAASYWLARADATLGAGEAPADAARALPFLARAAQARPRDFAVALRTSDAQRRAGHPTEAIAAAGRALGLEPNSANAWEALARARLDAGETRRAADAADHALALLHAYPGALFTRARAADRLGETAAAADARARLEALAATDDDARQLLATPAASPR